MRYFLIATKAPIENGYIETQLSLATEAFPSRKRIEEGASNFAASNGVKLTGVVQVTFLMELNKEDYYSFIGEETK